MLRILARAARYSHRVIPGNGLCISKFHFAAQQQVNDKAPQVSFSDSFISVGSAKFHFTWLRDHCTCPACYNKRTHQRKNDLLALSLDIGIDSHAFQEDGKLHILWTDGHSSTYDENWLHHISSVQSARGKAPSNVKRKLWGSEEINNYELKNNTTLDNSVFMSSDEGPKLLLEILLKYGFAMVSGVAATAKATKAVADKFCLIQKTFFGEFWEFTSDLLHSDTAYTSEYIGAHNDNTYFNEPAGVIMLHCLEHEGEGGESFIVDGFNAARRFKTTNPSGYSFFSTHPIPAEYIEEGRHHVAEFPIFNHNNATGELQQIRYNIYDRAPLLYLPPEEQKAFYAHLQDFARIIRDPDGDFVFKLNPGTVLLFDNWRVLHGRTSFTGRRHMVGCYFGRSDYQSRARTYGLIP